MFTLNPNLVEAAHQHAARMIASGAAVSVVTSPDGRSLAFVATAPDLLDPALLSFVEGGRRFWLGMSLARGARPPA